MLTFASDTVEEVDSAKSSTIQEIPLAMYRNHACVKEVVAYVTMG
jgi:hypothetical protein